MGSLRRILVIKPLKQVPGGPKIIARLYYPYEIFELDVSVRRVMGEPIRFRMPVLVDRARARAYATDGIPETFEDEVDEDFIVKPRVSGEASAKLARKFALYYVARYWRVMLAPEIRVARSVEAYKLYWLVRMAGKTYLFDSIHGDVEEVE